MEFVFIASDNDHMMSDFQKAMKKVGSWWFVWQVAVLLLIRACFCQVTFVKLNEASPHVDLAILGKADHYIGNCVSTFSHFATRERRSANKSVEFWSFPAPKHDEL